MAAVANVAPILMQLQTEKAKTEQQVEKVNLKMEQQMEKAKMEQWIVEQRMEQQTEKAKMEQQTEKAKMEQRIVELRMEQRMEQVKMELQTEKAKMELQTEKAKMEQRIVELRMEQQVEKVNLKVDLAAARYDSCADTQRGQHEFVFERAQDILLNAEYVITKDKEALASQRITMTKMNIFVSKYWNQGLAASLFPSCSCQPKFPDIDTQNLYGHLSDRIHCKRERVIYVSSEDAEVLSFWRYDDEYHIANTIWKFRVLLQGEVCITSVCPSSKLFVSSSLP